MLDITKKEYNFTYDHWDGIRRKITYFGEIGDYEFCITGRRGKNGSYPMHFSVSFCKKGTFGLGFTQTFRHIRNAKDYAVNTLKIEA